MAGKRVLNVNIGILGHVDSGKTSLVAALSTTLSTAALDKHPQSKERGITLDLGFSSFSVPLPSHLQHLPYDELQFTLVDCPGHASLIRTVIGGVQIIDMMLLVVDVTKGMQTQTAECLVIGEIATSCLIVALNKVDLLPEEGRDKAVRKASRRLGQTFDLTKFPGVTIVPVCARKDALAGLDALRDRLVAAVKGPPSRRVSSPFLFAIDHCFPIKGQGSVMTGTVLQGSIAVGETLELPELKLQRPVKSMQMFHQPATKALAGDRVGICVTQLDTKQVERGLAAAPGSVPTFSAAVASVEKVRFFAGRVQSKSRFHVSIGHSTVMAEVSCFAATAAEQLAPQAALQRMIASLERLACSDVTTAFAWADGYQHMEELHGLEGRSAPGAPGDNSVASNGEYVEQDAPRFCSPQWLLLRFDQPVTAPTDSLVIGARLDADVHGEACRLAFYGRLVATMDASNPKDLKRLKVFKVKQKQGVVERLQPDGCTAICRGMFKKETDFAIFSGLTVRTQHGDVGTIDGPFGKSGKFKVSFSSGLCSAAVAAVGSLVITLQYKRYIFDEDKHHIRQ